MRAAPKPARKFTVEPLPGREEPLPDQLDPARLRRRALEVIAFLAVFGLILWLAPGIDSVRRTLEHGDPGWLAVGALFELLSCLSYVVMFRPVFCRHMSRRTAWEIAWAELGMGSLVPASGAGGLALGAWILKRGGMPGEKIARRSVAFFLIKSSVNFIAVVVVGAAMAIGLVGPHKSPLLTALPAVMAAATIALVLAIRRLGPGPEPPRDASRLARALRATRKAIVEGVGEAVVILRSRNVALVAGAIGYWFFDNAVLWATYRAFGASVPVSVILMGYLIGQLGGALPLPGGLGGIDGGLIGTLVLYGAPAAATVAAVFSYRLILFWLPLAGGVFAFAGLRRALSRRSDLCEPAPAT